MSEPARRAASTTSAIATTRASAWVAGGRSSPCTCTGCAALSGSGVARASKIFPFGLAILAFVPAIIQLGVGAITNASKVDVEIFKHEDYFTLRPHHPRPLLRRGRARARRTRSAQSQHRALLLPGGLASGLRPGEVRCSDERDAGAHPRPATAAVPRERDGERRSRGVPQRQLGSRLPHRRGLARDLGDDRVRRARRRLPTCPVARTATAAIVGVFVITLAAAHILMETADPRHRTVRAAAQPDRLAGHDSLAVPRRSSRPAPTCPTRVSVAGSTSSPLSRRSPSRLPPRCDGSSGCRRERR